MSTELGGLLDSLAAALDISPSKYHQAAERYRAVGEWLDRDGSPIRAFSPEVYPQGSFRIGTVTRPIRESREADYDIDLVCAFHRAADTLSPQDLKNLVGDRLKEHAQYREMLESEGRKCWTLRYVEDDEIGFHLDALPACPAGRTMRDEIIKEGVPVSHAEWAIDLSEKNLRTGEYAWLPGGSNPEGYARWFEEINAPARLAAAPEQRKAITERYGEWYRRVEDVPDVLVRTPLQRAIQVLKRHRDVRFAGHAWEKEKPSSIIITTLAALAYRADLDLLGLLRQIVEQLGGDAHGFIERRDGQWWIPNPVRPSANLADPWNAPDSHRPEAFFEWLEWIKQDLALADTAPSTRDAQGIIEESFQVRLGEGSSSSGRPVATASAGALQVGDSSHCQAPPWPLRLRFRVRVEGTVHKGREGRELWRLSSRPVPKELDILFTASTNTPPPYEVMWQVVNTGKEAAEAGSGQLRGGFDRGLGSGGNRQWEGTRYTGVHWIEAFVIKDSDCVARSGRVIVRIR